MNYVNIFQDTTAAENAVNLRLEFVYHDFQSYYRLHARFHRQAMDKNPIAGEFHRIYFTFPRLSFIDLYENVTLTNVDDLSKMPSSLQDVPYIIEAHKKEWLYVVELEFNFLDQVNLHNPFAANTPGAKFALQQLRAIGKGKGKLILFIVSRDSDTEAFKKFRAYLSKEPDPLYQYYHKTGNYT